MRKSGMVMALLVGWVLAPALAIAAPSTVTFATLPPEVDGTQFLVSDGTPGNICSGGGTGARAVGVNGQYACFAEQPNGASSETTPLPPSVGPVTVMMQLDCFDVPSGGGPVVACGPTIAIGDIEVLRIRNVPGGLPLQGDAFINGVGRQHSTFRPYGQTMDEAGEWDFQWDTVVGPPGATVEYKSNKVTIVAQ